MTEKEIDQLQTAEYIRLDYIIYRYTLPKMVGAKVDYI
jgi:hypothetical protein